MNPVYLFPIAGGITTLCAWLLWEGVWRKPRLGAGGIVLILSAAMFVSLFALFRLEPITNWGLDFRLAASVAICTLIVQYIYVIGLLRHGIRGLGLFLLPATAVPLLVIPLLPDNPILRIRQRR